MDQYDMTATDDLFDDEVTAETGDDWQRPHIVRRKDALAAREREQQGVLMQLPYTGGYARVRILHANDKASLAWVPNHLRGKLGRMIAEIEGVKKTAAVETEADVFKLAVRQVADANDLADVFCVRGFVDPQLVMTEDELDPSRDDQMVVTDLHINERMGYFGKCMMRGKDVVLLDPFRGEPLTDVSGQSGNQATTAPVPLSRLSSAR